MSGPVPVGVQAMRSCWYEQTYEADEALFFTLRLQNWVRLFGCALALLSIKQEFTGSQIKDVSVLVLVEMVCCQDTLWKQKATKACKCMSRFW